ncbi:HupE/UreJ family protein [Pseudaminobacter sp. NGMCC 1.201702]|uniref:HupE/UreJ family protein n=1 Tax=Pseudaminobacter sp. NGMCC 1.201702 TaxID=3391825 RepID=UPI0039EFD418
MKRSSAALIPLLVALFAPSMAHAHLVNSGLGPFYDGALHLLLTPMDLVSLATLSLFVGLQGAEAGRLLVIVAPIAWFCAGVVALVSQMSGSFAAVNAGTLIFLGGFVALGLNISPPVAAAAAAVFGGLLGFQNGLELRAADADWIALIGTVAVVLAVTLLISALVTSYTAFAFRVVLRVLGSWAAATGLLSIGWISASGSS